MGWCPAAYYLPTRTVLQRPAVQDGVSCNLLFTYQDCPAASCAAGQAVLQPIICLPETSCSVLRCRTECPATYYLPIRTVLQRPALHDGLSCSLLFAYQHRPAASCGAGQSVLQPIIYYQDCPAASCAAGRAVLQPIICLPEPSCSVLRCRTECPAICYLPIRTVLQRPALQDGLCCSLPARTVLQRPAVQDGMSCNLLFTYQNCPAASCAAGRVVLQPTIWLPSGLPFFCSPLACAGPAVMAFL